MRREEEEVEAKEAGGKSKDARVGRLEDVYRVPEQMRKERPG